MKSIIKKLKGKLGCKRGEVVIGQAAIWITIMLVISIIITVGAYMTEKSDLDYMANELARYIEVRGDISPAQSEFNRLKGVMNIPDAAMSINADTISGTTRIQLEGEFTVILNSSVDIGAGGIVKLPVPIRSKASGRSEKYWK